MTTETLLEPKQGRIIHQIPMDEIITDTGFNCRGYIDPRSCIGLSQEIEAHGLTVPVTVRRFHDEVAFPGKRYALVAGFRRYMAHKILRREFIEAEIREGMTEAEAAILNLTENIEREDLNMMQEARAFGRLQSRIGLSPKDIASHLHKSLPWVQVRLQALDLEPEIQAEIEKGMLTQEHIKQIHALEPGEKRFAAVKAIKSSRLRNDKRKIQVGPKKARNVHSKKRRDNNEIFELQDHMLAEFGGGAFNRCPTTIKRFIQMLGWAAGEATDMEVYDTLRKVAEENGLHYDIPEDALDYLKSAV